MNRIVISACAISVLSLAAPAALAAPHAAAHVGGGADTSATAPMSHRTPTTQTPTTTHGPAATGQPKQSCGSATAPNTPGASASAPGSPFNEEGRSGQVYAGEQPQNSRNTASVSQYDAACAHQP